MQKEETYDRTETMQGPKVKLIPFIRSRAGQTSGCQEPQLTVYREKGKMTFNSATVKLMDLNDANSVLFVRRSDTKDFLMVVERDSVGAKGIKLSMITNCQSKCASFRQMAREMFSHYKAKNADNSLVFGVSFDPALGAWALAKKEIA